jgi:hypothetical protein
LNISISIDLKVHRNCDGLSLGKIEEGDLKVHRNCDGLSLGKIEENVLSPSESDFLR